MTDSLNGDVSADGHSLTRLGHEGRRYMRHDVALPCRLSFTRAGLRGVGTVLAVTCNVSRSGALMLLQRDIGAVDYVNVDFGAGTPPVASIVRHRRSSHIGVKFFGPMTRAGLDALLASRTAPAQRMPAAGDAARHAPSNVIQKDALKRA